MIDFDRLFELLEKADFAADCDCSVTTLAYLRIAQAEAYRLVGDAESPGETMRLRRAAQYVERKVLAEPTFHEAAHYAWAFWHGFVSGWEDRTMPGRVSDAYKMGRRFSSLRMTP